MKKVSIKVLSLLLVIMTLVGVISLPVSAAYSYPMEYLLQSGRKTSRTI